VGKLVDRVREATGALMEGDVRRYFALVDQAPDYTLMPPTGGPTRHGRGDGDLELEQSYVSGDLAKNSSRASMLAADESPVDPG
jgi:hypothetical protein